ncbi:MAG TPA: SMP-30/gluconolactonase/LRE family protein [Gemmatimonadaceae bacterium]|nr:SMP-30/gluconolactonase/LRE family protein [Gemmatimonadaceae bacterium]
MSLTFTFANVRTRPSRRWIALLALLIACGEEAKDTEKPASTPRPTAEDVPGRAATATGFKQPESARYDSLADVFFISNINGKLTEHDNNGFISRMRPDGTIDSLAFIAGGRNGVTLDAPKGMVILGDTLWVTDIDVVRGFDRRTGAPVATVSLKPQHALFLNDIAVGPDGALYITDTGLEFTDGTAKHPPSTDRIFKIAPDHTVTVALKSDSLDRPNGITWDLRGKRFIVVPYGGSKRIFGWRPGEKQVTPIGFGAGRFDGVEVLPDGRLLVSSWADSSVTIRSGNVSTSIGNLPSPADVGIDTRRLHVAVPLLMRDRVEIFSIPPMQKQ